MRDKICTSLDMMSPSVRSLPSSEVWSPLSTGSAVGKILAVLEYLSACRRSVSIGEMSKALQLSRSQTHRIVAMMEREEMLVRHPLTKRVMVGMRVARLACHLLAGSPLKPLWHVVLHDLAKEVGATCNFVVYEGSIGTYFDRIEIDWPDSLRLRFGSKVPLYCTAGGKLYLANLSDGERETILNSITLSKLTSKTITSVLDLDLALKQIAVDQVGVDAEEFVEGMVAVAVPVFTSAGILLGTIAVHAKRTSLEIEELYALLPRMRLASSNLAQIFEAETLLY